MNFFFRTNFNKKIGLGHLFRVLRIYNELKKKYNCKIFIDNYDSSISHIAKKSIFQELYKNSNFKNQITDAKIFFKKIKNYKKSIIINDDYRLDKNWEEYLSKKNYKIVTIDDLNSRNRFSDIIVNYDSQYLETKKFNFNLNKKKNCKYLLGPKYCILPKIKKKIKKNKKKNYFSITINIGGSGDLKIISKLLNKILFYGKNKKIKINVVIGPLSKNKNLILRAANKNKNIIPIKDSKDLIDIYRKTDLFVGAAGTSVFETSLVGLPSVLISMSHNQDTDIFSLENIGHYFFLKKKDLNNSTKISKFILLLISNYKRISQLAKYSKFKVDTLGVNRIIDQILSKKKLNIKNFIKNKNLKKSNNLSIKNIDDKEINYYLKTKNLNINLNHSTYPKKVSTLDHYLWWFASNRKSYVLIKNNKKVLYFYEQKVFKIKNESYYLSGWYACSKECGIKEILHALNWQRNMSKNYNWVSFIKKNNKLSIYLSKYLGWKEMSANELALQKLKLNFNIKNNNYIFYKR